MINPPITTEYVNAKSATYEIASGENPTPSSKLRGIAKAIQQLIAWLEQDEETPTNLSFASGYGNFGGFTTAQYYKDRFKRVFLKGVVARTSGSSGLIGTLPVGWRPAQTCMYSINVYDGAAYRPTDLRIDTSGNVTINIVAGVPSAVSFAPLDGISFRVA
jgi:hypothetical protein